MAETAYVGTLDTGIWEAAACADMELIFMMPADGKKRVGLASCVEEAPFSFEELLPVSMRKYSRVILYISLYMVAGPALIMCNKHLVKDIGFNFPLTLSLWSQFMGSVIVFGTVHGSGVELENSKKVTPKFFLYQIMPIGALMAMKMIFGMSSYLHLTVSFIQMFKAFTPAITLFVLFMSGVESPSRPVTLSVLTMCLGMSITCLGEVNFSTIGVSLIFAAQLCEAMRLVLMQRFIKELKFPAIELQYYRAPACAAVLLVAAGFTEFREIYETGKISRMIENIHLFLLQSFLGFAVNIVNSLVIKISNSVTLKVLAVVRNAALVFINMFFFGEVVTGRQFSGYGVLLVAFAMFQHYRRVQFGQAKKKDAKP